MTDLLERVYQAFDPTLLAAGPEIYVDLDAVRGAGDVVAGLESRIRLSSGRTCQLLAGHLGSGKSTELKRLEQALGRAGEKRYFVVFIESKSDLDLNDVDFPEILIAIVRTLAKELKKRENISLQSDYFRDLPKKFKELFGKIDKVSLDLLLLKLSLTMKGSPDARKQVRRALDPDTSNLLDAANELIGEALVELRKKSYTNIVIIVDDLDKIALRTHGEAGRWTAEYLFVNRHAQLAGFACHTVYTMPLALVYSALGEKIGNLYGARVPVVPMTRIRTRPPDSKVHEPGMDCFRRIVAQRLSSVGTDEAAVFGKGVIDKIIKLSGGQPRELMMLVREALIGGGLPVQPGAVDRAEREGARAYSRQLTDEQVELIKCVAKSGEVARTKENDAVFRELLDSRAVLQYVNNEDWFGVNPLIDLGGTKRKKK